MTRPDGVEIYWERRGEGPDVVVAPYFMGMPDSVQPFLDEMAADHTVTRFDGRGTGHSTRQGPHDMETGAADLEAVLDEVCEGPAVVVGIADACNRAVRVAASRPDLVAAVLAPGAAPIPRAALRDVDAMAGSDAVVGALIDTLENYYASGLRTMLEAANPQMSDDELKARIEAQVDYLPQEVAVARIKTWINDNPFEQSQSMGERLVVLTSPGAASPWWPSVEDMVRLVAELLPEARIEEAEDGLVSRPEQAAEIVRSITANVGVRAGEG